MGVGAVGAHAYGEVALEVYAFGTGIFHLIRELPLQVPLYPAPVIRFVAVALGAEFGILVEPVGVVLAETLEEPAGFVALLVNSFVVLGNLPVKADRQNSQQFPEGGIVITASRNHRLEQPRLGAGKLYHEFRRGHTGQAPRIF